VRVIDSVIKLTIFFEIMKVTALFITMLCLLCAGCATKIRTEVTAFHQWPEDSGEKRFRFVQPGGTLSSLERENYERLIRTELVRVGLKEAANSDKHILEVSFNASVSAREVRVIEKVLVDSWYGTPWYGPGYYSPYWGAWSGYGASFYGPFSPGIPVVREREHRYTMFYRELKLTISDGDSGQPLFETTVLSEGKESNLPRVMPYMVRSAFADFPGKSGKPQIIEMKFDPAE